MDFDEFWNWLRPGRTIPRPPEEPKPTPAVEDLGWAMYRRIGNPIPQYDPVVYGNYLEVIRRGPEAVIDSEYEIAKGYICIFLARALLGPNRESEVQDQAVELMTLSNQAIINTFQRVALP